MKMDEYKNKIKEIVEDMRTDYNESQIRIYIAGYLNALQEYRIIDSDEKIILLAYYELEFN